MLLAAMRFYFLARLDRCPLRLHCPSESPSFETLKSPTFGRWREAASTARSNVGALVPLTQREYSPAPRPCRSFEVCVPRVKCHERYPGRNLVPDRQIVD